MSGADEKSEYFDSAKSSISEAERVIEDIREFIKENPDAESKLVEIVKKEKLIGRDLNNAEDICRKVYEQDVEDINQISESLKKAKESYFSQEELWNAHLQGFKNGEISEEDLASTGNSYLVKMNRCSARFRRNVRILQNILTVNKEEGVYTYELTQASKNAIRVLEEVRRKDPKGPIGDTLEQVRSLYREISEDDMKLVYGEERTAEKIDECLTDIQKIIEGYREDLEQMKSLSKTVKFKAHEMERLEEQVNEIEEKIVKLKGEIEEENWSELEEASKELPAILDDLTEGEEPSNRAPYVNLPGPLQYWSKRSDSTFFGLVSARNPYLVMDMSIEDVFDLIREYNGLYENGQLPLYLQKENTNGFHKAQEKEINATLADLKSRSDFVEIVARPFMDGDDGMRWDGLAIWFVSGHTEGNTKILLNEIGVLIRYEIDWYLPPGAFYKLWKRNESLGKPFKKWVNRNNIGLNN